MTIAVSESEHLPALALPQVPLLDVVESIGDSVQDALRKVILTYGRNCMVELEKDKTEEATRSLLQEKVVMQALLIKKLKEELVREKLTVLELQKERTNALPSSGSPHNVVKDEATPLNRPSDANPWDSPPKPLDGTKTAQPPSLLGFRFYSATPVDDAQQENQDAESLTPSPNMASLRGSMMGQFLPSTLLDSPCVMPSNGSSLLADTFSLDAPAEVPAEVAPKTDNNNDVKDASSLSSRRTTSNSSVDSEDSSVASMESTKSSTLAILSDMFDGMSISELQEILTTCNGDVSKAMDHILKTHSSFNPAPLPPSLMKATSTPDANFRPPAGNWKTEMCMYYLQGKCNKTRRTCSFAHGESDLVRNPKAMMPPLAPTPPGYKSRLCPLYLEGQCPKARRDCLLAHGESDLIFREPSASSGSTSSALPPILGSTNPAPRLQNYKTELCYYFLKGCCNYSTEECRFAHGEADLRTVESNTMEWGGNMDLMMNSTSTMLERQMQYQQQAPHQHAMHPLPSSSPPPPPPPPTYQRYMMKDEMIKRRITLPARRDSLNHISTPPTWSTTPTYDY